MQSLSPTRWYCARTQPKHEHIAAAGLRRNLGLEVFEPRLGVERATRRGLVRLMEPVFPCYIFVRCLLDEHADEIRYVNGVSTLVHFGRRIPVVPDEVIEELRQRFQVETPIVAADGICAGAEVTVTEGAFLGLRGIVARGLPAKQRVEILLDFLGRVTVAEGGRKDLTVGEKR